MGTSAESTSKPTSTPKPTKKPEKQTESTSAQSSEETTVSETEKNEEEAARAAAAEAERLAAEEAERTAAEQMSARRSEVIAYEKQKNGYSSTEQGERYLDEPCGYCGVTDVYIDKYGACAICYDEYVQPEFGWCEVCGAPLNPAQSAFKRCWSCMKCQYCGIDMSSYINYDTGGVDSADGTWTCWDCYDKQNTQTYICSYCGKEFQDWGHGLTCPDCAVIKDRITYCDRCGAQINGYTYDGLGGYCNDCYSFLNGISSYDPLNPDSAINYYPGSDVEVISKCYYCGTDISQYDVLNDYGGLCPVCGNVIIS